MTSEPLVEQVVAAWRRHAAILLHLLHLLDRWRPQGRPRCRPPSRGREVAAQFAHLDRVRRVWLHYHVLALKQSAHKMPQKVAIDGLWGKWLYGD
jgi:hypothetical protein